MKGDAEAAIRYRQHAEEVRIIADDMKDVISRLVLIDIAEDYERMARQMDDSAATDRKLSRTYGIRNSH